MRRIFRLISLIFVLSCSFNIYGQDIRISVDDEKLNEILSSLITEYDAQISFNDSELSHYQLSLKGDFNNIEAVVRKLISGLPLQMEKNEGVIIIYEKTAKRKAETFTISGRVVEQNSNEPLPYSHLMINGKGTISDLTGNYSFSSTDSIFSLKISHLGYYILDTAIAAADNIILRLNPAVIGLNEVVIKNSIIDKRGQYGQKAGLIKLNQKIANYLPGYGDNSIFNLLRLQPGILASGEQTNGLIIWGSYEGQSRIGFDGFTIYGLKNFNDNISSFNPLMAKDIEVFKGGFDASMGERVGGIVNVSGKMGNTNETKFEFTANNMTLNALMEIPIRKKGSLVIAFRNTYYELYDKSDLSVLFKRNTDNDTTNNIDLNIQPNYKFRDMNIKYSTRLGKNNDLFFLSFYGGIDRFSYNIEDTFVKTTIKRESEEDNIQSGLSAFYSKRWGERAVSNFTMSFSSIRSTFYDNFLVIPANIANTRHIEDKNTENRLQEASLKIDNSYRFSSVHLFEYGAEILNNSYFLSEDTFNINYLNMDGNSARLNLYFQDDFHVSNKFNIKPGLRFTHAVLLKKVYADPRLSLKYSFTDKLKLNIAWGIYHQYISRSSVVDNNGNYKYIWALADNIDIPVLEAYHYVAGLNYSVRNFTFNTEFYYKNTFGLTRYIRSQKYDIQDIFTGKARAYGIDVLLKQDIRKHSFWVSYSLGKTEELFTYFLNGKYRRAPQDQRHEIKAAAMLNFEPWYFSANYVFGSGFPDYTYNQQQLKQLSTQTYSRLDVSVIYRFLNRKLKGETGLSILNVLNRQNFKLANFERIPSDQTNTINIYAEAIPFTPTLYLKIYL